MCMFALSDISIICCKYALSGARLRSGRQTSGGVQWVVCVPRLHLEHCARGALIELEQIIVSKFLDVSIKVHFQLMRVVLRDMSMNNNTSNTSKQGPSRRDRDYHTVSLTISKIIMIIILYCIWGWVRKNQTRVGTPNIRKVVYWCSRGCWWSWLTSFLTNSFRAAVLQQSCKSRVLHISLSRHSMFVKIWGYVTTGSNPTTWVWIMIPSTMRII